LLPTTVRLCRERGFSMA